MRFLPFILAFLPLTPLTTALEERQQQEQEQQPTPQIVNKQDNKSKSRYSYLGCYNETTNLPNTSGERALYGGINLVAPDVLTVEKCWDFCATNNTAIEYKYAGLEYARY
ncbi:hypothetical protein QBC44DRAFT_253537, partial [Cladorrhinum sp. PSN332]